MGIFDGIVDALTTDDGERADLAQAELKKREAEVAAIKAELEAKGVDNAGMERLAKAEAAVAEAGAAANDAARKVNRPPVYNPAGAADVVVDETEAAAAPVEETETTEATAVAAAPAKAAPKKEKKPEHKTYTVKRGDTLSEIAAKYGVSWREMAKLNHLDNPDLIFPGQVFKIPND